MIEQKIKTKSGKEISWLIPENDDDVKKLQELEASGQASSKAAFGDWKKKPKTKKPNLTDKENN